MKRVGDNFELTGLVEMGEFTNIQKEIVNGECSLFLIFIDL